MIGNKIKKLRKKNHMTQTELSDYLNIGQSTLANFENGRRIIPIDIIIKLASYFNVTTDYLLGLSTEDIRYGQPLLSDDEQKLIDTYRQLNSDEKQVVLGRAIDFKLTGTMTNRKKDVG